MEKIEKRVGRKRKRIRKGVKAKRKRPSLNEERVNE